MLQIVNKMYFREGVELYSTVHRAVLYTNRCLLGREVVELPVGELAPSTLSAPVTGMTLSVTEYLESENLDGTRAMQIATGGVELIDALADVLAFGLNSVFSRDRDLVVRLVPDSLERADRSSATRLFRHTFDPRRYITDVELIEFREFMRELLALDRTHFEAAMRAVRRVVGATQRAIDDPTIAYVDIVAALESLSDGTNAPAPSWDRMDGRKRKLIDGALANADAEVAERVRQAVIEAERLGAKHRFVTFVMQHITPDYFRAEANGTIRPMRGADLERAVKVAYDIRSRNVHVLEDLPPEAWVLGDRGDTVTPPGMGTMLSHEGLARLANHVIKEYVRRAPSGVDASFDWRASLPGKVQMPLAPQYWIHNVAQFDLKSVDRYFSGFVKHLTDVVVGRTEGAVDMRPILTQIEQLLSKPTKQDTKMLLVAIYALWHCVLVERDHQPAAGSFLNQHAGVLQAPEMPCFVVGFFSGQMPEWSEDQWHTLAHTRREERARRRHLELPAGFDAGLQVAAAGRLLQAGRAEEARELARFAIEELPGDDHLIAWEAELAAGRQPEVDFEALVLRIERHEPESQTAGASSTPAPDREPQTPVEDDVRSIAGDSDGADAG